jgi:enoyl-CoA hydratase
MPECDIEPGAPLGEQRSDLSKGEATVNYGDYHHLLFDPKPNGVLLVTLNRPDVMNATNARLHWELTQVWKTVDDDAETKVVLVTGAGKAFSAGGDLEMVENMAGNPVAVAQAMREAADIVYNMINLDKPIVSAINGVAVGAGLAVALMADVSIMSESARITDGHLRLGVGAGDHAAIIWPLLCGMAKAKYYLLTADFIDGKEAERIGLVSLCAPADRLMAKAWDVADRLAAGPQQAQRWTKRALNNWLRVAGPIFDTSLAYEMLNFLGPDVKEGVAGIKERRPPKFPSAK